MCDDDGDLLRRNMSTNLRYHHSSRIGKHPARTGRLQSGAKQGGLSRVGLFIIYL